MSGVTHFTLSTKGHLYRPPCGGVGASTSNPEGVTCVSCLSIFGEAIELRLRKLQDSERRDLAKAGMW